MTTQALPPVLSQRLNPAQYEAVTAPDGPLLILAGAGSGKTRVIAYRMAYLVLERQVPPEHIVAVTFTNKAAGEMKARVEALIGPQARALTLGTFHSICARWLRRDISRIGYESSFSIYDDDDQISLLKRLYVDAGINPKQHPPPAIRAAISRAKEQLLTPTQYSQTADGPFELVVGALFRRYQEALQEQNALDFDDLLVLTLRLFDQAPDLLDRYQRRFRHVLVDEYQDVNRAQYLLVKGLAAQHRNLTIVGDDSQAIYGWRGADVKYILEFEHDFPECQVARLEQNYRSTKTILHAAQAIEAGLRARREKHLHTDNPRGQPITVCRAADERDEAMFIVREVEKLHGDGSRYRDFAVMYRMNSQSRAIEEALIRRRLPYQIVGGTRFYERREIKDVLAYLRLTNNPNDGVSLERVINVPQRGIGDTTLEQLRDWASALGIPISHALRLLRALESGTENGPRVSPPFNDRARAQLLAFGKLLSDFEDAATSVGPVELFDTVILRTAYRDYLINDKAGEERWENVMELRTVVSDYEGMEPGMGLRAFLENVSLVADVDSLKDEKDAVTLLTLHSAKGLEYPVVFITGMEDGIFPHRRALDSLGDEELDEERRLCYVGITRAMQRLYLVHADMRTLFGIPKPGVPSEFLAALPSETVRHVEALGVAGRPTSMTSVRAWSGSGTRMGPGTGRPSGRHERKNFGPVVRAGASTLPKASTAKAHYTPGDRVRHETLGEGTVLTSIMSRAGVETVTIDFGARGKRLVIASAAPMERVH
ncbi:MAG: ATP-dependent helicase [Chloroflexota bacterium]